MKFIYIILGAFLLLTACEKLDQVPPNIASADSLTDFDGVLNAAYFYQLGTITPMAVMGDFRADNAYMFETPYDEFDQFDADLTTMEDQFFGPFYTACYKSILSANTVIEKSLDAIEIGEAKFLRALSYFKLVRVFGDATINLSVSPSVTDQSILVRQAASAVYNDVIIPDLKGAIADLDNSGIANGRASQIAAQGMLAKVYMQMGNFGSADNDLNSEIIYATQISSSISDEYGFSEFWSWSGGLDTKSLEPLDLDLIAAFNASPGDLRRDITINDTLMASPKWILGLEQDWIELRLGDVILLYAEALNENGDTPAALVELNKIRTRAGLENSTSTTQAEVRTAIANERRLELAFEGQRWFDLVRTGTVDAEMGETINSNYHLFPIPDSEVLASDGIIKQNPGY